MIARIPFKVLLRRAPIRHSLCWLFLCLLPILPITAGYKAKPYVPLPIESYPSRLTSEGLTVAVDPMFTDAIAARAFDKKDIVERGIMPLAIIILNSNGFAVEVAAGPIELLVRGIHIRPVSPEKAFRQIYQQTYIPPYRLKKFNIFYNYYFG